MITFTRVKSPNGWLNNMSHHYVVHDSLKYGTVEHLFHALRFADINIREEIRQQDSPMKAKILAKIYANKMNIAQRGLEDLNNMRLCLLLKINQHADLANLLLATGDQLIVENVTRRVINVSGEAIESALFWGMKENIDGTWSGENWLGRLWMETRKKIQNSNACNLLS